MFVLFLSICFASLTHTHWQMSIFRKIVNVDIMMDSLCRSHSVNKRPFGFLGHSSASKALLSSQLCFNYPEDVLDDTLLHSLIAL